MNSKTLYRRGYADSDLASYLERYYNKVDRLRQQEFLSEAFFEIAACEGCGLYYQVEIPDDDFSSEIYNNWLGFNDPLAPGKPHMPMDYYAHMAQEALQLLSWLRERDNTSTRVRVLDFGLGWGHWAEMMRACGADVVGTELSERKIAHAKSRGLRVASLADLRGEEFDFINTEQVVEHLAQPRAIVKQLSGFLGRNGIIKLSVPDGHGVRATLDHLNWARDYDALKDAIMPVQPLEHLNCFTPDSLRHFGAQCGLTRVSLPLGNAYRFLADSDGLRGTLKSLGRPIKRYVLHRGCYALFASAESGS